MSAPTGHVPTREEDERAHATGELAREDEGERAAEAPSRRLRRARPGASVRRALGVGACALGLLLGAVLLFDAYRLTSADSAENRALTDTEATAEVTGEVNDALSKIFSYTPDGVRTTELDAKRLLRGTAADQYRRLYGELRERVTEQQLTLTTRVVESGVVSLRGDTARLLVFLDQSGNRDGRQRTTAAAQLSVTAERQGGEWRIVRLAAR